MAEPFGKRVIPPLMAVALLVACGQSSPGMSVGIGASTARHSTPPSSNPPQAAGLPAGLFVLMTQDGTTTDSLRFMDAKGRVVASTQFAPPPRPAYGPCASLIQPAVRVANNAAYFSDSTGVIRKMTSDGAISQVAAFTLVNTQQALSYAVSPDGSQLIAIVFNTPPRHNPPPQTLGDPLFDAGTWSIDLETARAGAATSVVLHKDLGNQLPPSPTIITGWDHFGPTATLNSAICTQNGLPSPFYTGALIHLAMDGTHLDRIGGSTCNAYDELLDGTVLCGGDNWQSFSVRNRNGDELWSRATGLLQDVRLAPDGNAVASGDGAIYARYTDQAASFARTASLDGRIIGWAGQGYAVALRQDGHVGLVAAMDPLAFSDLGVTVQIPCPGCAPYGIVIGTVA